MDVASEPFQRQPNTLHIDTSTSKPCCMHVASDNGFRGNAGPSVEIITFDSYVQNVSKRIVLIINHGIALFVRVALVCCRPVAPFAEGYPAFA